MTDLALDRYDPRTTALHRDPISRDQVELLKRTICKGATDDELKLFITVCNTRGLNPFVGQIHAVKRNEWDPDAGDGKGGWTKKMTIQTGIDGYRLIAKRTGEYAGRVGPWWCGPDGQWRDVWLDEEPPAAAKVGVRSKNAPEPTFAVARWNAYVQTKKGGEPTAMWTRMGAEQLAKCAEALALRVLFPQELSGIYTDDEMLQAEAEQIPGRQGGESPMPAQPAGPSVPTLEQISRLRSPRAAANLIKAAPQEFQALIPRAIADVHGKDPHWFWDNDSDTEHWQQVLEYTLELHEQHQHETAAAGVSIPPAGPAAAPNDADPEGPERGRQETTGSAPNPDRGDD